MHVTTLHQSRLFTCFFVKWILFSWPVSSVCFHLGLAAWSHWRSEALVHWTGRIPVSTSSRVACDGLESGVLITLVGGVEQIEVDNVCRDTYDAQVMQDKCKYVSEIDGTDTRQNTRVQQQVRRPPCLHVHCIRTSQPLNTINIHWNALGL